MIRIPGTRTGIEIWYEDMEGAGLVPLDQAPIQDHLDILEDHDIEWDPATQTLINPHLWVFELVDPQTQALMGQMVLADPHPDLPGLLAAIPEVDLQKYFGGLLLGYERWLWSNPSAPWPDEFILRASGYPTVVLQSGAPFYYSFGSFTPPGNQTFQLNADTDHVYVVDNDSSGAGYVVFYPSTGNLLWIASTPLLVQQLISPSAIGEWEFTRIQGTHTVNNYTPFQNGGVAVQGMP